MVTGSVIIKQHLNYVVSYVDIVFKELVNSMRHSDIRDSYGHHVESVINMLD